ncbi:MAG: hypothetical protein ACRCZK_01620, partial [Oscillospiraceae bacterium]
NKLNFIDMSSYFNNKCVIVKACTNYKNNIISIISVNKKYFILKTLHDKTKLSITKFENLNNLDIVNISCKERLIYISYGDINNSQIHTLCDDV